MKKRDYNTHEFFWYHFVKEILKDDSFLDEPQLTKGGECIES